MLFKANNKQIEIYNYYVTNACVLQFISTEDTVIKDFFNNLGEIETFDIIDSDNGKIVDSRTMILDYTHYMVENTEITEYEYETVQEAYDEKIVDDETKEETTVHHDAIVRKIEKKTPVEMTSVFLEQPSIEISLSSVRSEMKNIQNLIPNINQFQTLINIQCASLTDAQAVLVSEFYEAWEDIDDGTELEQGKRLRYNKNGLLYKVKSSHKKQSDWNPVDATTLFEVIEISHAGTKEDPIPAHTNMEYQKDKYYIENNVIYLCNSELAKNGIVLQYTPSQLVGIYFQKIE